MSAPPPEKKAEWNDDDHDKLRNEIIVLKQKTKIWHPKTTSLPVEVE
jgi:hypothetical protein